MDDDTIPTATALEALVRAAEDYPGTPALLASKAVWTDGAEHPMNRPRTRPGLPPALHRHAALAGARQIRTASFVSILLNARAVREVGLPRASYFLWNDDFEYTSRILRGRVGLYVPGSIVHHLTRALGSSDADPGERFRFEVRNKVWTFRDSEGLGAFERMAYEAATARRWLRATASSGFDSRMAEETTTVASGGTLAASWPTATARPSSARRRVTWDALASEPDTRAPSSASSSATTLMPAPPIPMKW